MAAPADAHTSTPMTIDQEVQSWTLLCEARDHHLTPCQAHAAVCAVTDEDTAAHAMADGLGAQCETLIVETGDLDTARHLLGW